jgi:hypothetical protein
VETLISIHGEIDEDFMKNVKKQSALKFWLFQFHFFISNFWFRVELYFNFFNEF